jgi:hypothetical protein
MSMTPGSSGDNAKKAATNANERWRRLKETDAPMLKSMCPVPSHASHLSRTVALMVLPFDLIVIGLPLRRGQ